MRLFNTLSGRLEEFQPLREGEVRFYACGPTVYDYAHIGNFRAFVFEDLLRRVLEAKGWKVKHVMNITDVDDKTIRHARKEGVPLEKFTARFIDAFFEDLRCLNVLEPNYPPEGPPRATREIPAMIEIINKLIERGAAYVREGSVYYRVNAFPGYGKLSKKKLHSNLTGVRVDVDEYGKEQVSDFALWKKAKEDEPAWDSPWGKGRPGWHIECSAMSMKYLGTPLDIHAGGEDLIFPHHENEIAQSEAAMGQPFVRYWLHCRFLLVDGEKMSKSKGNFYTLRDLLSQGYDPMAIRYTLLTGHYRTPLNFTFSGLQEAAEIIRRLDDCYFHCLSLVHLLRLDSGKQQYRKCPEPVDWKTRLEGAWKDILLTLEDDLNISVALARLHEEVSAINRWLANQPLEEESLKAILHFFERIDQLLGLDIARVKTIPQAVMKILHERHMIRAHRDFKKDRDLQWRSDEKRSELMEAGWLVKDARPGEWSTLKKRRRAWD